MSSEAQRDVGAAIQALRAVAKPIFELLAVVVPLLISSTRFLYQQYSKLPQNALTFLTGACFCFFGGTFPTLFAAIQAAEHGGRAKFVQAVSDLSAQATIILEESKKDDMVDHDKDGKKDVHQLSGSAYMTRKTKLVLRKMNPDVVDQALGALYSVWLSVAAVLVIQFARVISMALTMADFLNKPANRFITPVVQKVIPDDYDKWVPIVMGWITKSIAMSIAWYIQSIISATTSALAGGLMMARAAYKFGIHHKVLQKGHEESVIDEVLSYVFAALGFYVQFQSNFGLPFPLNFVLWPFQVAEYWIRWTITK